MGNMNLYDKALEVHYQDLRRERAESRRRSYAPQNRVSRHGTGQLGMLLMKLGSRLKQFEQSSKLHLEHIPHKL